MERKRSQGWRDKEGSDEEIEKGVMGRIADSPVVHCPSSVIIFCEKERG